MFLPQSHSHNMCCLIFFQQKMEDKANDIVDRFESTEYPTWQAPASDYSHSTSKSSKSGKSSKSSKGSKSSSSKNIEGGAHSGGLNKVSSKVQYMANSCSRTFALGRSMSTILGSSIMLAMYCHLY